MYKGELNIMKNYVNKIITAASVNIIMFYLSDRHGSCNPHHYWTPMTLGHSVYGVAAYRL